MLEPEAIAFSLIASFEAAERHDSPFPYWLPIGMLPGDVVQEIYALPVDHRWHRVPGVTLLGDAAHLMAPSGEGANLAMFDGAELGRAIAANPGDLERAVAAYERELFPRSAAEAAEAIRMIGLCLGDDAPHGLVNFFRRAQGRT